jgi:hypothetical protein
MPPRRLKRARPAHALGAVDTAVAQAGGGTDAKGEEERTADGAPKNGLEEDGGLGVLDARDGLARAKGLGFGAREGAPKARNEELTAAHGAVVPVGLAVKLALDGDLEVVQARAIHPVAKAVARELWVDVPRGNSDEGAHEAPAVGAARLSTKRVHVRGGPKAANEVGEGDAVLTARGGCIIDGLRVLAVPVPHRHGHPIWRIIVAARELRYTRLCGGEA